MSLGWSKRYTSVPFLGKHESRPQLIYLHTGLETFVIFLVGFPLWRKGLGLTGPFSLYGSSPRSSDSVLTPLYLEKGSWLRSGGVVTTRTHYWSLILLMFGVWDKFYLRDPFGFLLTHICLPVILIVVTLSVVIRVILKISLFEFGVWFSGLLSNCYFFICSRFDTTVWCYLNLIFIFYLPIEIFRGL